MELWASIESGGDLWWDERKSNKVTAFILVHLTASHIQLMSDDDDIENHMTDVFSRLSTSTTVLIKHLEAWLTNVLFWSMKLHGEQQCFKLKVRKWKICKYFAQNSASHFQSQVKLSFQKLQIGKLFGNLAINDRDKNNLNNRDKYNLNDRDKYNLANNFNLQATWI